MHELSLCQNLIDQVEALAQDHGAVGVARLEVQVGLLSGVEAQLLEHAFTLARAGTIADAAELHTQTIAPRVTCRACDTESAAAINDLRCRACGSPDTSLIAGQALILARVELVMPDMASN